MSENTKIEWADHTFNPWEGCQKVGPGCDHCYAETRNARFGGGVATNWGPGAPRRRTSEANWRKPSKWNAEAARLGIRYRVFCASLADVFDNEVPAAWRVDLLRLIANTPHLDWLLLTKRIGNAHRMMVDAFQEGWPNHGSMWERWGELFPHVWIGATICNQPEADRDIAKLQAVPARVRFLSMEPLLGPVDLGLCDCDHGSRPGPGGVGGVTCSRCAGSGGRRVDWVIVGGESGPSARPMHPDWARSLRDQCQAAGVPFLFKQWGEFFPKSNHPGLTEPDQNPNLMIRIGKKAAGRLLDGRTWDEFPA